jgi:hypothetical protein
VKLIITDDKLGRAGKRLLKEICKSYQAVKDGVQDIYNVKWLSKLLRKRKE